MARTKSPATLAIHPRREEGPGPLVTPIFMSSTFRLRDARQGAAFTRTIAPKAYYTRWGNPTVADLEDTVAKLEGGRAGVATGSGMGAIAPAILTCGTRRPCGARGAAPYPGAPERLEPPRPRFGVRTTW